MEWLESKNLKMNDVMESFYRSYALRHIKENSHLKSDKELKRDMEIIANMDVEELIDFLETGVLKIPSSKTN